MRREGGGEREKARREGGRRVREREGKFHIFYMEQATLTGNSTKLYGTFMINDDAFFSIGLGWSVLGIVGPEIGLLLG